jgi:hypothetical protein
MAKSLKIGVGDLMAELGAHAFVLGDALKATGAIATRHLQALSDGSHDLFVRIFFDFHGMFSPSCLDFW